MSSRTQTYTKHLEVRKMNHIGRV